MTTPVEETPVTTPKTNWVPHRKLQVSVVGGAIVTVVVFFANRFGAAIDAPTSAALVVIVSSLLAYFIPAADQDSLPQYPSS
jgi:hypothetical protein